MTYAGCSGCGMGAAAVTGVAAGAAMPISTSGWNMANALADVAGRIMEDPFLDDAIFSPPAYHAAMNRSRSALQRLGRAVGVVEVSEADARQLVLGSVKQAKRAIAWMRVMAYSPSPRARVLEQQAANAVRLLLQSTNAMLQETKARRRSGTSGMGVLLFVPLIISAYLVYSLIEHAIEVDSASNLMAACAEAECTPDERAAIIAEWARRRREAEKGDRESGGDPFGIKDAIGTVIKVVAIGGAALAGGYLLWVTAPVLLGAGRKIRGAAKKRYATPVKANRRRRRRRTSR